MIVAVEHISKIYLGMPVLQDVSVTVEDHDRIGLIGANGAGKSTLLKIICGLESPDSGSVYCANGKAIGFLQQNSGLNSSNTIQQEMKSVFLGLLDIKKEIKQLEQKLSQKQYSDNNEYLKLTQEYASKQTFFEQQEGYLIDVKIDTILNGMGFEDKSKDSIIGTLSGGEKTRLAMAKLLLQQPDLLVLDEPTNHLDFKTLGWLEEYLSNYKGAILTVSHDRYFLDRLVSQIWEAEQRKILQFKGNYTKYTVLKQEYIQRLTKEYESQQQQISSMQDYIDRNRARASTAKSARGRQNALDRIEKLERPAFMKAMPKIKFTYDREPVKDILDIQGLSLEIAGKPLLNNLDFHVFRGEKFAIIGNNGVGKSSFLNAIQRLIPVKMGSIKWGHNVNIGYYRQEMNHLNPENSVLEELWGRFPSLSERQIRTVLGGVLFSDDTVFKKVSVISGGEKARLSLAAIMLLKPNVLIMDEPTNHLDLHTKEVLEQALLDYTGTIIMVSHDRYLLNKIPDKIFEMSDGEMNSYTGGFDSYKELKLNAKTKTIKNPIKKNSGKKTKAQKAQEAKTRARIRELEQLIETTEEEIKKLEQNISNPKFYLDFKAMNDNCENLELQKQLHTKYFEEWVELSENE